VAVALSSSLADRPVQGVRIDPARVPVTHLESTLRPEACGTIHEGLRPLSPHGHRQVGAVIEPVDRATQKSVQAVLGSIATQPSGNIPLKRAPT
jgi:hypothetical protein